MSDTSKISKLSSKPCKNKGKCKYCQTPCGNKYNHQKICGGNYEKYICKGCKVLFAIKDDQHHIDVCLYAQENIDWCDNYSTKKYKVKEFKWCCNMCDRITSDIIKHKENKHNISEDTLSHKPITILYILKLNSIIPDTEQLWKIGISDNIMERLNTHTNNIIGGFEIFRLYEIDDKIYETKLLKRLRRHIVHGKEVVAISEEDLLLKISNLDKFTSYNIKEILKEIITDKKELDKLNKDSEEYNNELRELMIKRNNLNTTIEQLNNKINTLNIKIDIKTYLYKLSDEI